MLHYVYPASQPTNQAKHEVTLVLRCHERYYIYFHVTTKNLESTQLFRGDNYRSHAPKYGRSSSGAILFPDDAWLDLGNFRCTSQAAKRSNNVNYVHTHSNSPPQKVSEV